MTKSIDAIFIDRNVFEFWMLDDEGYELDAY